MEKNKLMLLATIFAYLGSLSFLSGTFFSTNKVPFIILFIMFASIGTMFLSLYNRNKTVDEKKINN